MRNAINIQSSYVKNRTRVNNIAKNFKRAFTNKKQHKTANAPAFENLTAISFNEFLTFAAEKLCGHYKCKTMMPNFLTPRVAENFVLQKLLF